MVWSIASSKRRKKLADAAARSRDDRALVKAAWVAVVIYNCIGIADIWSTSVGIGSGLAEEANPVVRAAMDHFGPGWIAAKLFLQGVITFMVLWFPHRLVLAMFAAAVCFNAGVVWSNLRIAGLL